MCQNLDKVFCDNYGRKVLSYLLCPRNPQMFNIDIINILKQGDTNPYRYERINFQFLMTTSLLFFVCGAVITTSNRDTSITRLWLWFSQLIDHKCLYKFCYEQPFCILCRLIFIAFNYMVNYKTNYIYTLGT